VQRIDGALQLADLLRLRAELVLETSKTRAERDGFGSAGQRVILAPREDAFFFPRSIGGRELGEK
jgi:hypothetical protein